MRTTVILALFALSCSPVPSTVTAPHLPEGPCEAGEIRCERESVVLCGPDESWVAVMDCDAAATAGPLSCQEGPDGVGCYPARP